MSSAPPVWLDLMTSILWNTLKDLASRKKFVSGFVASLVAALGKFGLELDESTILLILSPILTAIFGQGISDHGKER